MKLYLVTVSAAAVLALCASAAGHAGRAAQPVVTLTVAPLAFSPNADGVKDTLRASIGVDVPVTLVIEISDSHGNVVFTNSPGVTVNPGTATFHWNGKDAATGLAAPDGKYSLTATATDPATSTSAEATAQFVVDTKPPVMLWGRGGVSPALITGGRLRLRFRLYDATATRITLGLEDQTGRKLSAGRPYVLRPGKANLRWPEAHAVRLPSSTYALSLSGVDAAGNTATSATRHFVVVRPARAHVWADFRGVGRRIALTFDDCYVGSAWASILGTLKRYGIKATFFCPGEAVLANRSVALRTVRDGHVIGSHGWDHADFTRLSFSSAESRLVDDRQTWWKLAHVVPTPFFRPPYGAYNATTVAAAGRAGYSNVILWDVDPRDWTQPGSSVIEARILSQVRPGSIVLMHTLPQTAAQLPSLIQALRARHYIPLTLPELARIGTPTSGGWPAYNASRSSG